MSDFASIALSALPLPQAVEALSIEALIAARKVRLLQMYPDCADVLALESEPLVKLIEAGAYREYLLRERYNTEARALTLAYATGTDLDHIGITYYQEPRAVIQAANSTVSPPLPEVLETDDAYRRRLQLKPASYSVAGPTDAYKFHAISAHPDVLDVGVDSPYPGTTRVSVLSRKDGGVAAAALLAAVEGRLNPHGIRPLCEEVLVQAVQVQSYTAQVRYWTYPGVDATATGALSTASVLAAVGGYSISTSGLETRGAFYAVGMDHTISEIARAAKVAGVQDVQVLEPAASVLCNATQAAVCMAVNIEWMGVAQ
jgi:phage-related baseplate assembly protein